MFSEIAVIIGKSLGIPCTGRVNLLILVPPVVKVFGGLLTAAACPTRHIDYSKLIIEGHYGNHKGPIRETIKGPLRETVTGLGNDTDNEGI